MTIKVIERGAKPDDQLYRKRCNHCRALLEFKRSDIETRYDRAEPVFLIRCPECEHILYPKESDKYISPNWYEGR